MMKAPPITKASLLVALRAVAIIEKKHRANGMLKADVTKHCLRCHSDWHASENERHTTHCELRDV
jgi:hypothetical protein